MRVEHLNPFAQACGEVLGALFGSAGEQGALAVRSHLETGHAINVAFDIGGDLLGSAVLGMSLAAADRIATKIMGMPIVTFDAQGVLAIAEFGAMVASRAVDILGDAGWACSVSAPTVVRGKKARLGSGCTAMMVPIDVNGLGLIEVGVSAQDQRQQVA